MRWLFREPTPDQTLGEMLRRLETASPESEEALLRQRIVTAAVPILRGLRAPAPPRWWEWISRWMPVAVPVGLAASLAATLLVSIGTDRVNLASSIADAGADSTLVIAAFSEGSTRSELTAHLVAPAGDDWLFEEAVSR
jgi:hypothetical protein